MNLLIQRARLHGAAYTDEKRYDIRIADGKITEIGENLQPQDEKLLPVDGKSVFPGLIDMHCNVCEPGYEHIENIASVSLSALKGGFTSITCEPNTKPAVDNKTVVEYIISKSKAVGLVNIFPYGSISMGCEGKDMAEIGEMYEAGIVGVSDGDKILDNAALLRNVMRYTKMFDLPVMTHCEDRALSGQGMMHEGYTAACLGIFGMPREAEEVQVSRNIVLAEATGARLHIAPVSTRGAVRMVRDAKKRGISVTCETCPHYFALTDEAVEGYQTLAKVNPPLRTKDDVQALLEGIADGTIDVIASGHSPTTQTEKNHEFDKAAYGISALETAFSISYTHLVDSGVISAERLNVLMSKNPAEILHFSKKGVLQVGYDADLIVVDTEKTSIIDPSEFASKAKFSPFAGKEVKGQICTTIVGGSVLS